MFGADGDAGCAGHEQAQSVGRPVAAYRAQGAPPPRPSRRRGHAGQRVHKAQVPRYAVFTHQLLRAVLQVAATGWSLPRFAALLATGCLIGCATTPRPVTINGEQ